jgi:hypothetical protein
MNRNLFDSAHKLQEQLNGIDADADKTSLIWAHGFLTGLLANLTSRVPELAGSGSVGKPETAATKRARGLQEETGRILDDLKNIRGREQNQDIRELSRRALKKLRDTKLMSDESDILERLFDDLDESSPTETSGVPANRKPSPKGLSGGVALPLPN